MGLLQVGEHRLERFQVSVPDGVITLLFSGLLDELDERVVQPGGRLNQLLGLLDELFGNVQLFVVEGHGAGVLIVLLAVDGLVPLHIFAFVLLAVALLAPGLRLAVLLVPHLLQFLHDALTLGGQVRERRRAAHVAMPLGGLVGDEGQLLPAQVAQDALLAEGVVAEVAANQFAPFSAPSGENGRV